MKILTPPRLETILIEEFDKANLPGSAQPHIDAIRYGEPITPGIQAALSAMARACRETMGDD